LQLLINFKGTRSVLTYIENFPLPSVPQELLEKYTERRKEKIEGAKFERVVKKYINQPLARHSIRTNLSASTRIEEHLEKIKSHDDENEELSMKMREDMLYE